jgi:dolichol-phosphate mannosyltransferase
MANEGAESTRFVMSVLEQCIGFQDVVFFAVFDTASTDNSLALLQELAQVEPRLKVVWAPENQCVVDAYVRGYREALAAGAGWILEIDAGFSHQPAEIPQFFDAMCRGYHCVFGSRFMKGGGFSGGIKRYLVSRGGTLLANLLLGTRQTDMTSGFELFSRDALQMVLRRGIQSHAHFFQTEIKAYCSKLHILEVPIHYSVPSPRLPGAAVRESVQQLWRLFKLRRAHKL